MTTAQVVETSVTHNSLSEDYSHPDDHTRQILLCISPNLTSLSWSKGLSQIFRFTIDLVSPHLFGFGVLIEAHRTRSLATLGVEEADEDCDECPGVDRPAGSPDTVLTI